MELYFVLKGPQLKCGSWPFHDDPPPQGRLPLRRGDHPKAATRRDCRRRDQQHPPRRFRRRRSLHPRLPGGSGGSYAVQQHELPNS